MHQKFPKEFRKQVMCTLHTLIWSNALLSTYVCQALCFCKKIGLCDQLCFLNDLHITGFRNVGIQPQALAPRALGAGQIAQYLMQTIIHQIRSVAQFCLTLCDPMNCRTPGLPVHHQLLEFTQTHVHRVSDAIQPSHPLLSPSPSAPNPSQHQGLFQWVNSSHEVAKVLEFQLQYQSFQWTPRTDFF